jgi:oligoribonuclease
MKLLWTDLETSGLDPQKEVILEVAVRLATIERPFDTASAVDAVIGLAEIPPNVDAYVLTMHEKNGLWAECKKSRLSVREVEDQILAFARNAPGTSSDERTTLAGSTAHFDLGFLRVHMPRLAAELSHRIYDVSSVKLFCRSLGMPKPPKAEAHRAMADILESIDHAKLCARWLGRPWEEVGDP